MGLILLSFGIACLLSLKVKKNCTARLARGRIKGLRKNRQKRIDSVFSKSILIYAEFSRAVRRYSKAKRREVLSIAALRFSV